MTIQEVVDELREACRVRNIYNGIMPQSTFSQNLGRIERGEAKKVTVIEFFNIFGYVQQGGEWCKSVGKRQTVQTAQKNQS